MAPPSNSKRSRKRASRFKDRGGAAKKQKPQRKQPPPPKPKPECEDPVLFGSDSGSEGNENPKPSTTNTTASAISTSSTADKDLQNLLEPYHKEQLISFLCDAAISNPSLLSKIHDVADRDVSHRKIFVHNLSWDTTRDDLVQAFSPFGTIVDSNVVLDKITGRAKGYGFVLFDSRLSAVKALKQPQKHIKNRLAVCQLASVGPMQPGGNTWGADNVARKIYVSNVHTDAAPDKLREFFAKFGEIEMGPLGYDTTTGKSRGFALFLYKTQEGARKALEEPYKMFDGHQLHCQKSAEQNKGKSSVAAAVPVNVASAIPPAAVSAGAGVLRSSSQPVLAAMAAAQNLALISQNPAYAALLGQNPFVAAALSQTALNPAQGLNPSSLNSIGGLGVGAYGGSPSLLGPYGTQGSAALQGTSYGQSASLSRTGGSHRGLPYGPYLW